MFNVLNESTKSTYLTQSTNHAGLLINTYNTKTKNKTNRKEKKTLRSRLNLFKADSFFKAAFIFWFFKKVG